MDLLPDSPPDLVDSKEDENSSDDEQNNPMMRSPIKRNFDDDEDAHDELNGAARDDEDDDVVDGQDNDDEEDDQPMFDYRPGDVDVSSGDVAAAAPSYPIEAKEEGGEGDVAFSQQQQSPSVKQEPAEDETDQVTGVEDVNTVVAPEREIETPEVPDLPQMNVRESLLERQVPDTVLSVLFWDNVKISGAVLTIGLTLLTLINSLSFISVFAYTNLTLLFSVWAVKMYASIQSTLNSREMKHPLQDWLEYDIKVTPEKVQKSLEYVTPYLEKYLKRLQSVVVFENTLDTLKMVFILYLFTYVGAALNLVTLLLLSFLGAFSLPILYEKKQKEINALWKATVSKVLVVVLNAWTKAEPKLRDTFEKMPPFVKNPVSKFLKLEQSKVK